MLAAPWTLWAKEKRTGPAMRGLYRVLLVIRPFPTGSSLPPKHTACSIPAFHTVRLTFFSCSSFPTRTQATASQDFCLFCSLPIYLERCLASNPCPTNELTHGPRCILGPDAGRGVWPLYKGGNPDVFPRKSKPRETPGDSTAPLH